jgi:hypothetical protein
VQRSLCQCPFLRAIHHLSEKNRHGPDTAGSVTRERNGQFEPWAIGAAARRSPPKPKSLDFGFKIAIVVTLGVQKPGHTSSPLSRFLFVYSPAGVMRRSCDAITTY